MKKISVLCLCLMFAFSFTACGSSQTQSESSEAASEATTKSEESSAESIGTEAEPSDLSAEEPESTEGKTLVVYYSATGSTENVAGYIADAAGADLFTLEPVIPYTSEDLDWTNDRSRVSVEHENESERVVELVSATVDNWNEYDTVFVGYPIWWYDMPQMMYSFFDEYDFSGKTIIPFNSHGGSGFSGSVQEIAELEPDAIVRTDGLTISRTVMVNSENTIVSWLETLGIA